jgi:hypothetical protein
MAANRDRRFPLNLQRDGDLREGATRGSQARVAKRPITAEAATIRQPALRMPIPPIAAIHGTASVNPQNKNRRVCQG